MAKKKDSAEDNWFDDEEVEEEKKPKKKSRKGKSGKIIAWIVAFALILGILLFIRFKYAGPAAPAESVTGEVPPQDIVEEQQVVAPEKNAADTQEESGYETSRNLGKDVVPKEELPNLQSQLDINDKPELFSNLRCDYDTQSKLLYINLRIYNVLDEDIKISPRGVSKGYNTYFKIRGNVDLDPGCGTELLQKGEYTDCKRIGFDAPIYANIPGINRISVQVPGKTEALLITCPELPKAADGE